MKQKQQQKQLEMIINILNDIDYKACSEESVQFLVQNLKQVLQNFSIVQNHPKLNPCLSKSLDFILNIKINQQQIVDQIQQLLFIIIDINLHTNFQIASQCLSIALDPIRLFHRYYYQDKDFNKPLGFPLQSYQPSQGQQCDVVKPYLIGTYQCGWTRCKVINLEQNKVQFINNNKIISTIYGQKLFSPLNQRTYDFDWRFQLKPYQLIDAMDEKQVWYESTVMDMRKQQEYMQVKVGFRYYDQKGNKMDSKDRKYFGWPQNYDEWIEVTTPRIQRQQIVIETRRWQRKYILQQVIRTQTQLLKILTILQKRFYAIQRPLYCNSYLLVNLVNYFGERQGFNKIVSFLQQHWYNTDICYHLISSISKIYFLFPRIHIKEFINMLCEAICNYLGSISTVKLLSKQKIEFYINTIDFLMKRAYSLIQKYKFVDDLRRKLALLLLSAENLERNIIALKLLSQAFKIKGQSTSGTLQSDKQQIDRMKAFIKQNKIFQKIFHHDSHIQMLQRSTDFLIFLADCRTIDISDYQYLWKITMNLDLLAKNQMLKVLSDISYNMQYEHLYFLNNLIIEMKEQELSEEVLQLLYQINKHSTRHGMFVYQTLKYLWQLITQKTNKIKKKIQDKGLSVICNLLSYIQNREKKYEFLTYCLQKIGNKTVLKHQIKMLKKFIQSYRNSNSISLQNDGIPNTIKQICAILIEIEFIHNLIINLKVEIEQFPNQTQFIKQKLEFLTFILNKADAHQQHYYILKQIYDALGPCDLFFQWVAQMQLNDQIFQIIFTETNFQKYKSISNRGWNAFKQLFIIANYKKGYIRKNRKKNQNQKEYDEFVMTRRRPEQLIGMFILFRLSEVATSVDLQHLISDFIIQLHINLDQQLLSKQQQIRSNFCNNFLERLKEFNKNVNSNNQNQIQYKINNQLYLMNEFINTTQRNGIKGFVPHNALLKKQKIKLKIENNYSFSSQDKQIQIQVYPNITLMNLRQIISQILKLQVQKFQLINYSLLLGENKNGKTLSQLNFIHINKIKINKKYNTDFPKYPLLDQNNQFTDKALSVFKKEFWNYEMHNKMDGQQCALFFTNCTKMKCVSNQTNIRKIFQTYGKKQRNVLYQDQFIQFYRCSSIQKPDIVWRNLINLGYNYNLNQSSKEEKSINIRLFPRYILSLRNELYQILFEMLQNNHHILNHFQLYKFLCRFPCPQSIYEFLKAQNYQQMLLSKSTYERMYIVYVICAQFEKLQQKYLEFMFDGNLKRMANAMIIQDWSCMNSHKILIQEQILNIFIYMYGACQYSQQLDTFILTKIKYTQTSTYDVLIKILKKQIYLSKDQYIMSSQFLERVEFFKQNCWLKQKFLSLGIDWLVQKLCKILNKNYKAKIVILTKLTVTLIVLSSIQGCNVTKYLPLLLQPLSFQHHSLKIAISNAIYVIIQINPLLIPEILKQFLNYIQNNKQVKQKYSYITFYQVLVRLIKGCKQNINFNFQLEAENLFKKIIHQKLKQPQCQLMLLEAILEIKNQITVKFKDYFVAFFQRCLYFENPMIVYQYKIPIKCFEKNQTLNIESYPICSSMQSRKYAYHIILMLLKSSWSIQLISNYIMKHVNSLPPKISNRKIISRYYYVGIYNLGCICYMSAIIQVFYFITTFRSCIYLAQAQNNKPLYQLKRMFSYLEYSERMDFVPDRFLKSFDNPISINVQQDTSQFLDLLFSNLQKQLKGGPFENILDNIYTGSTITQMICHGCNSTRQREQNFNLYRVGVKGKTKLYQALQATQMGEIISDCFCQGCMSKNPTTRRTVLGKLPNIMLMNLERIIFDFDLFINVKLHTRLQFPFELDLQPYTKQGIELREQVGLEFLRELDKKSPEEQLCFNNRKRHGKSINHYKYILKAIIVHSGSAEVGHYYSIIRQQKDKWIKLDDSKYSWINQMKIQIECFGGQIKAGQWQFTNQQSTNAYVLVYQKLQKEKIQLKVRNDEELKKFCNIFNVEQPEQYKSMGIAKFNFQDIKSFTSQQFYKEVWIDNHYFFLQNQMFTYGNSKQYLKFLFQVVSISKQNITNYQSNKAQISKIIIQLCLKICFQVIPRSYQQQISKNFVNIVTQLIKYCPYIASTYLNLYVFENKKKFLEQLLKSQKSIRTTIKQFTISLINSVEQPDQDIIEFIDFLLENLNTQVIKNWTKCDQYFSLLRQMMSLSQIQEYYQKKEIIAILIDFILQKQSPLKSTLKRQQIGNKYTNVQFSKALQIICLLIKKTNAFNPNQNTQKRNLTQNQLLCVSSIAFYEKMFFQRQGDSVLFGCVISLCEHNYKFSQQIAGIVLKGINNCVIQSQIQRYLDFGLQFLLIDDNYVKQRLQWIMGFPLYQSKNIMTSLEQIQYFYQSTLPRIFPIQSVLNLLLDYRKKYQLIALVLINFILNLCEKSQMIEEYIMSLPSPTIFQSSFIDCFRSFILQAQLQNISSKSFNHIDFNQLINKFQKLLSKFHSMKIEKDMPYLVGLRKSYILGEKESCEVKQIVQIQKGLIFKLKEYVVNMVQSKPYGSGNYTFNEQKSFNKEYFCCNKLKVKKILQESNIQKFVFVSKYKIVKKEKQQQEQYIVPILDFDEQVKSKTQQNQSENIKVVYVNQDSKATQLEKIMEEKQQEQNAQLIFLDGAFKDNYLRQIEIVNETDETIELSIKIDNEGNALLPRKLYLSVRKYSSESIFFLKKELGEWGQTTFKFQVQGKDKQKKQKKRNNKLNNIIKNDTTNDVQIQTKMINYQNNQKDCLMCTYKNYSLAQKCEICGHTL